MHYMRCLVKIKVVSKRVNSNKIKKKIKKCKSEISVITLWLSSFQITLQRHKEKIVINLEMLQFKKRKKNHRDRDNTNEIMKMVEYK